uniref:Flavodoxin-like domain-containing protein n=1 Tax=Entomoneis paludosa TaxID=265537 RepID=A0A7S2YRT5_9STRA|mmetsp:Transcript_749/g.1805  ORF Transcript_749/g.1805 Transcript_749/m.1805 type:complete len:257 (+) Transcript_749:136-906(+)|eukprot:CAMPEP_0172457644 /NCGR_PEP_ID=MMETSP1065-20121228/23255_1 /TAXON_ID=265537 /ORGANISM="Amphiprora paludosa, Strain CCMP125" /LENGTH=256 /DNA_ID=CAMNT_0013211497 /DNA_START=62 /DNA_END=832 /DNA_ORIENTATION=-
MTTESNSRTEKIYVLYASQTGNSEQAAIELCSQVPTKLSPSVIQKLTGTKDEIIVEPVHMQLDDFLELDKCTWTRLMVIITSSYGVGQAPLGGYRYRDLCDAWYKQFQDKSGGETPKKVLEGLSFAMCGLGDSKYTTYFQNPTRINEAMHLVGAKRVGPLGKADASGTGNELQGKVVEAWMKEIWSHLAKVVVEPPLSDERLKEMQMDTVQVCRKINPDFEYDDGSSSGSGNTMMIALAILVALVAVLYYLYMNQN